MLARALILVGLLIGCCLPAALQAGQGAHNVVVVINQRSVLSQAVGQQYARLRNIPAVNLIYLDWEGSPVSTDVETFRERILKPILKAIDERQLTRHITTVAYSSDFPYVIDFQGDIKPESQIDELAKRFPQGSITGLTYLGALVAAKDVRYAQLGTNFYYRPAVADKLLVPTRGYVPLANWTPQGEIDDKNGIRYLMAVMLAYTSGRGNSLTEVENYLRRSLVADGTYPQGKMYYLKNGDIRAKTREPNFLAAAQRLEDLGVASEVIDGVLPRERADIMGAMIGAVDYRFADSGSKVRGGAICENLTSFGGILRENGGQTALSECLRAGAAGSSGTVTEPYAIQAKFPHPMIHVHYASGCSLVESFYQSVQGPYQLLVVGDPLARPYATIPAVKVTGLPDNGVVKEMLKLTPSASIADGKQIKRFELYVDGRLGTQCPPGQTLEIDTRGWMDGEHDVRVVAYEDSLIATTGEFSAKVVSMNHGWGGVEVKLLGTSTPSLTDSVTVVAFVPGAAGLVLYHNQRLIGALSTDRGAWTIPARLLGLGKSSLHVMGVRAQGPQNACLSREISVDVLPTRPKATSAPAQEPTKLGLKLKRDGQESVVIEKFTDDWAEKAGLKPGEKLTLEGLVRIDSPGLYQFQAEFGGRVRIDVGGVNILDEVQGNTGWRYATIELEPLWQPIAIHAVLNNSKRLSLHMGSVGTSAITGEQFRHAE